MKWIRRSHQVLPKGVERQYKHPGIKSAKAIFSKLLTNCKPQSFIFFSLKGELREKFQFSSHTCTRTHSHIMYRCTKHELGHESYIVLSLFTKEVQGPGSAIKQRQEFSPMSKGRCSTVPGSFSSCAYSHENNLYVGPWSRAPYLDSHVAIVGRNCRRQAQSEERGQFNQTMIQILNFWRKQ